MLNSGRIEELRNTLQDEIYTESLKEKPNAKKRYAAMKKYFTYVNSVREACQKPCIIEFEGGKYTSFCNSYSLALTKEDYGEIKLFDNENGNYPDVTRLINYDGVEDKIDFSKVIAEAKSKGYRLKKSEVNDNNYLMLYDDVYFRIGLLDATFGIIDDGEKATVYHVKDSIKPLTIKTDIGVCVIMPVRYESEPFDNTVIIEV